MPSTHDASHASRLSLDGARPLSSHELRELTNSVIDWVDAQGSATPQLAAWLLGSPSWETGHMAAALRTAACAAMEAALLASDYMSIDARPCIEVAERVWIEWARDDGIALPSTNSSFGEVRRKLGPPTPPSARASIILGFVATHIKRACPVSTSALQRAAWINAVAHEFHACPILAQPLYAMRAPHVPPHGVRLEDVLRVAAEVRVVTGVDVSAASAGVPSIIPATTLPVTLQAVQTWALELGGAPPTLAASVIAGRGGSGAAVPHTLVGTSPALTLALLASACNGTLHDTFLRLPLPHTVGLPCLVREALSAPPLHPATLLTPAPPSSSTAHHAHEEVVPPAPPHVPTAMSVMSTHVPPVERFMVSTPTRLALAFGKTLDAVACGADDTTLPPPLSADGMTCCGGGLAALLPQPDETRGSLVATVNPASGACTFYLFAPTNKDGMCMSALATCVLDVPLEMDDSIDTGEEEDKDHAHEDGGAGNDVGAAAAAAAGGGRDREEARGGDEDEGEAERMALRARQQPVSRSRGGGGGASADAHSQNADVLSDDGMRSVMTRPLAAVAGSVLRRAPTVVGAREASPSHALPKRGRGAEEAEDVGHPRPPAAATPVRTRIDWVTAVRDSNDVLTLAWGGRNMYTGSTTWACHTGIDDVALLDGRVEALFDAESSFESIDISVFAERASQVYSNGMISAGTADLRVHGNLLSAHVVWNYASGSACAPSPTSYIIYQDTVVAQIPNVAVWSVWGVPTRCLLLTSGGWAVLDGGVVCPLSIPALPRGLTQADVCAGIDIVPWSLTNEGILDADTLMPICATASDAAHTSSSPATRMHADMGRDEENEQQQQQQQQQRQQERAYEDDTEEEGGASRMKHAHESRRRTRSRKFDEDETDDEDDVAL